MKVSPAQLDALRWLKRNGGLDVPHMNMLGRSSEWPTHATLKALLARGLIDYDPGTTHWRVDVNELGQAVLDACP